MEVFMYDYFDDKEFLKRAQRFCTSLVSRTEKILQEKNINSQMFLVGSGGRNMITRNGSGPIDFDYNLNVISCDDWDDTKGIKDKVMNAFNKALAEENLLSCSDSTASLGTKPIWFEDVPEVKFSIDLAIVTLDNKGLWNRLIHEKDRYGNPRNDRWIWNIAPNSQKLKEKADFIKETTPKINDIEKKLDKMEEKHISILDKITKSQEEIEEVEEEEEFEDKVGEDFSKDPRAMTYLQDAGRIADEVLQDVISKCKPGAVLYELCTNADALIKTKLSNVYRKKKFIKGIAFPTCISVNEICGNYSAPLEISDDPKEKKCLAEGDVAKIDLGVEICGFAAVVAHTVVVSATEAKISGKKAEVILAAYNSIQAALRMMKENDKTNNDITAAIEGICKDYNVNPVEGVLSHKMKKDIIDGFETIINKATFEQRVDTRKFEFGDVFGLDVIVSTGEGKPKETGIKTNIYKRALETTYKLRTDSARKLLSVVESNFYSFPFSFNQFEKEENVKLKSPIEKFQTTMKLGLSECTKYELLHPYPVLAEKPGDIVTVKIQQAQTWLLKGTLESE